MPQFVSRRSWLQTAGLGSLVATVAGVRNIRGQAETPTARHDSLHSGHLLGTVGEIEGTEFSPDDYLRSFNFSHLPDDERARWYRETLRPDGSTLREYEIFAVDREIEIA